MKLMVLSLIMAAFVGGASFAEESKTSTSTPESAVTALTKKDKKSRKKKVEMCAECGKPESECECKDHKGEEHTEKKEEKKGS